MRLIAVAIGLIAGLPVTGTKPAAPFHVDGIIPGEGAESDCFNALRRPGDKPLPGERETRNIFEEVNDYAFIKIDGKIHQLKQTKPSKAGSPITYQDSDTIVVDASKVTGVDKSEDGNTYYLNGKLVVAYRGQTQTIAVTGISFCYSGG